MFFGFLAKCLSPLKPCSFVAFLWLPNFIHRHGKVFNLFVCYVCRSSLSTIAANHLLRNLRPKFTRTKHFMVHKLEWLWREWIGTYNVFIKLALFMIFSSNLILYIRPFTFLTALLFNLTFWLLLIILTTIFHINKFTMAIPTIGLLLPIKLSMIFSHNL